MENAESVQLHIFCDASEMAYAAVAYFRIEVGGGEVHSSFIMAKSRVAPLRPISIPRLELQAAVMGTRLAAFIKEEHDIKVDQTFFWSDSKTVLLWLRSDARCYKTFVAHRVGEILESTDVSAWRWVPTLENVADEATRDNKEVDFSSSARWFTGPQFLLLPQSEWPVEKSKDDKEAEADVKNLELKSDFVGMVNPGQVASGRIEILEEVVCLVVQVPTLALPDPTRFSSWRKLLRVTAWVIHFIGQLKRRRLSRVSKRPAETRKNPKDYTDLWWKSVNSVLFPDGNIIKNKLNQAEILLFKQVQRESFSREIQDLQQGKSVSKSSRLFSFSCFLDDDGVLRLKGRTQSSKELDYSTSHPIILDPKHLITRLLIDHFHILANHNGQEMVINELRQRFWILDMRTAVRSAWSRCISCRNRRARPLPPIMAPLPEVRINRPPRPFSWTGVDYFGPMEVKVGRRVEKRYGVLFTCLSTRAIHLEIAHSLSTDSAIMAIRRMAGRRGCPDKLYSDNGTNFRGASRELGALVRGFDQKRIMEAVDKLGEKQSKRIEWHFIPPAAPHFGRAWERMVRSVSVALEATLKVQRPTPEMLETLMVEAEFIVNSRPLTHVSLDPNDPEALTPNHFLLGPPETAQPEIPSIFLDPGQNLRSQWRRAKRLADQFWQRWIKEYLPTLTRRTKWNQLTRPARVGDVVYIADGNLGRNCWPKGVIIKLYPGRDGVVRVVDVKTPTKIYRRPLTKICILDVNIPETIDGGGNVAEASSK